jgi:hypothetical protein
VPLGCVANIGDISSAGMYTFCAEQCQSAGSLGARTDSFRPWEQIRCDPDFREVYCNTLRKERVRKPATQRFRGCTPLLPS